MDSSNDRIMTQAVPIGFETVHAEWLRIGGPEFRNVHRFGPRPDFYKSQYWKLVKHAVLTSKGFKCCRCTGVADQVHHLNYDFVGEDHFHPQVLVAICGPCHGLVEYARNAESLISRISRRISLCRGFLEGSRGCLDQDATHVYARLLEYRDELAELRRLFATETRYRNPRIKSEAEATAVIAGFRQARDAYQEQAASIVSAWEGTERERAERLLPMLESEIENCTRFVAEVHAPVLPRAERLSSPSLTEVFSSAEVPAGVEALVVGIKFHRGHAEGVAQDDVVQLLREPNNPYDSNAIRVCLKTGETLGYLAKESAAVIAKEMDAGMCPQGKVSRTARGKVYVAVTASKI